MESHPPSILHRAARHKSGASNRARPSRPAILLNIRLIDPPPRTSSSSTNPPRRFNLHPVTKEILLQRETPEKPELRRSPPRTVKPRRGEERREDQKETITRGSRRILESVSLIKVTVRERHSHLQRWCPASPVRGGAAVRSEHLHPGRTVYVHRAEPTLERAGEGGGWSVIEGEKKSSRREKWNKGSERERGTRRKSSIVHIGRENGERG